MTPEECRTARRALGLTQQQLADCLQVTRNTIHKREAGLTPIGCEAVMAMRLLFVEDTEIGNPETKKGKL